MGDGYQGAAGSPVPLREADDRGEISRRQSERADEASDLHLTGAAGRDHRARQRIVCRVDDDSHGNERQSARCGDLGNGETLHVNRQSPRRTEGRSLFSDRHDGDCAAHEFPAGERMARRKRSGEARAPMRRRRQTRAIGGDHLARQQYRPGMQRRIEPSGHTPAGKRRGASVGERLRGTAGSGKAYAAHGDPCAVSESSWCPEPGFARAQSARLRRKRGDDADYIQ